VAHSAQCRPQDLVSFLLTLAYIGYEPANFDQAVATVFAQIPGPLEAPSATSWLDIVWSLAVLGRLQADKAATVLEESFIQKLRDEEALGPAATLKLLNVEAVAKFEIKDYDGPTLSAEMQISPSKTKNKEPLVI